MRRRELRFGNSVWSRQAKNNKSDVVLTSPWLFCCNSYLPPAVSIINSIDEQCQKLDAVSLSKNGDMGTPPLACWRRRAITTQSAVPKRRNTVIPSRHRTTPDGDATAEIDAALVASWLRKKRRLRGGGWSEEVGSTDVLVSAMAAIAVRGSSDGRVGPCWMCDWTLYGDGLGGWGAMVIGFLLCVRWGLCADDVVRERWCLWEAKIFVDFGWGGQATTYYFTCFKNSRIRYSTSYKNSLLHSSISSLNRMILSIC